MHQSNAVRPMRVVLLIAVSIVALMLASWPSLTTTAQNGNQASNHAYVEGVVLVGFKPGASASARGRAVAAANATSASAVSPIADDTVLVKVPPGRTVEETIEALSKRPGVSYAEPDYILHRLETSNDPYYTGNQHWGMYGDATSPSNPFGSGAGEAWASGAIGSSDVYVGVIDEGIQHTHPDLAANVWTNPFDPVDGADNDGNGYVDDVHGWDFWGDDNGVFDGAGDDHGTHVAGTIGARGGNGIGVAGVNWRVKLISAKFLGPGGGSTSNAIKAVDYLTKLKLDHGINIVATNNSYGGGGQSSSFGRAIDRAGDAGIIFVAAAGNDGTNNDASPHYPSNYECTTRQDTGAARGWDCVISVANITSSGAKRASSNYGASSVDLGAPGTSIYSTLPTANGSTYGAYTGTSMASPHVAGAVALCASLDPTLTAKRIRALVMNTATSTPSMAGITVTGDRLDIGSLAQQ